MGQWFVSLSDKLLAYLFCCGKSYSSFWIMTLKKMHDMKY